MIPSLRPVLPLFDTAPRWGNNIRLRPRHVFHNQRSLSHDTKSQKERFPYYIKGLGLTRETLLRRLSFPREYMPYWIRICLTTFSVPLLLIGSLDLIRLSLYRFWGNRNLPRVDKGSEGNSYTALLFYVFGIIRLLSILMRPWGLIQLNQGPSMQPTLRARPAPSYASYAYIDRRDVRRGDVVVVLPPERYNKGAFICKRIAGLGGDRIRVTRYSPQKIPHRIVHVRFSNVISLPRSVFTYGHYRYRSDTAFWLGIILQALMTQGNSVRCRLNPFWLKCNGDST